MRHHKTEQRRSRDGRGAEAFGPVADTTALVARVGEGVRALCDDLAADPELMVVFDVAMQNVGRVVLGGLGYDEPTAVCVAAGVHGGPRVALYPAVSYACPQPVRLTRPGTVSEPDNPLADLDIDVCNVRPAFEASLAAGIEEAELQARLGWTRSWLERDGATVSGASTYEHMAWMSSRPDFAAVVLDMVRRHTAASLGIVGLACKTAAFLGEALARHGRYQALINRTARYDAVIDGDAVRLEETRFGPVTNGSLALSDYTVLVAVQILRGFLGEEVPILALHFRRDAITAAERQAWEGFSKAPIQTGRPKAALVCPVSLMVQPLPSHDNELSAYFSDLLQQSSPEPDDAGWGARVRAALERRLADGTPTADSIGRELGVGVRTLARRLADEGHTFGALLTAVRRDRACHLLADENVTQAEVAFLLGYRDQASFHRAFRRWFGTTPAAFRGGPNVSR